MSYDSRTAYRSFATVGGPPEAEARPPRAASGWGPLVTVLTLGVLALVGYVGYHVAHHYLSHPSPYSVRRAATLDETTIVFPRRLAGMTRIDSGVGTQLSREMTGAPGGVDLRGAVYGVGGAPSAILGAQAQPLTAAGQARQMGEFAAWAKKEGLVGVADVAPGPLGGRMSCGVMPIQSMRWTTCFYADGGGLGLIMVDDAGKTATARVLAIRAGIERRLA